MRRIVWHHNHRLAKIVDEQTAFFICRKICRTTYCVGAARADPIGGSIQQSGCDCPIINRLEQSKETDIFFVITVVLVIDKRGDGSDHPS